SSSRSWAAGCTPSTPTTPANASIPTATAVICCPNPGYAGCCPRSGCGSAGISWSCGATRRGFGNGCGSVDWAAGRGSHVDDHRRHGTVQDLPSRLARPHGGVRQVRTVAAPGLAGHQTAVPPLAAGPVLDLQRRRDDRRGDWRPVLGAVQTGTV